jgi:hypothetical protein
MKQTPKCEIDKTHEWVYVTTPEEGMQRCEVCHGMRYFPDNMTYLDRYRIESEDALARIKDDPLEKKLFNFIKNELAGYINTAKDEHIGFVFNDKFYDNVFLDEIVRILIDADFIEERFDKKALKNHLCDFFMNVSVNNDYKVGMKQEIPSTAFLPLNDREFAFLLYVSDRLRKHYGDKH